MTSATQRVDVLVIGGGPTGLGAATRLQERGADWHLVEAADGLGGMASTVTDDAGFRWDLGGHVLHSHFADFDRAIADSGVRMLAPLRNGWVWIDGELVAAPIQHQVDELPDDLRPEAPAATLDDYYRNHLGARLHGTFFKPFTEKMWAAPLERIDHTWTSMRNGSAERNVPLIRVRSDAPPPPRESFPYPEGGTGALWDAVAARLDPDGVALRSRVCAIDLDARTALLADGEVIHFVDCVSSMPLTTLLRSVGRPDWAARSTSLVANSTLVVGLGYSGTPPDALADKSWLYCPDKDVAWHRATVLSNYDPGIAGEGRWSVLCEVGHSAFRVVDRATAVASCREEMTKLGADPAALVSTWVRDIPRGYPVPTLGRDDLLHEVDAGLIHCGVRSRGRFGGWRYESCNQDYSFQQGVEAVEAVMTGSREDAYWHPERF
ncbi:MAG: FAD-dependent oxidoreductase [Pseudonocardiales bacterium]|nr:FAD-dependent oxidoreductase [Pseudonocardiales bacterium]